MDNRIADPMVQQREVIQRMLAEINTVIPGVINDFFPATQTVSATPAVQKKVILDGEAHYLTAPLITDIPLLFPFASVAGFALTIPVRRGDPCLLVFSQRAIDFWHLNGGIQPPEQGVGCRTHSLTDAFAILAPSPLPQVLGAWETEGIELRNRAKGSRVTVRDSEVEMVCGPCSYKAEASGTLTISAPTVIINTSSFDINKV